MSIDSIPDMIKKGVHPGFGLCLVRRHAFLTEDLVIGLSDCMQSIFTDQEVTSKIVGDHITNDSRVTMAFRSNDVNASSLIYNSAIMKAQLGKNIPTLRSDLVKDGGSNNNVFLMGSDDVDTSTFNEWIPMICPAPVPNKYLYEIGVNPRGRKFVSGKGNIADAMYVYDKNDPTTFTWNPYGSHPFSVNPMYWGDHKTQFEKGSLGLIGFQPRETFVSPFFKPPAATEQYASALNKIKDKWLSDIVPKQTDNELDFNPVRDTNSIWQNSTGGAGMKYRPKHHQITDFSSAYSISVPSCYSTDRNLYYEFLANFHTRTYGYKPGGSYLDTDLNRIVQKGVEYSVFGPSPLGQLGNDFNIDTHVQFPSQIWLNNMTKKNARI